MEEENKPIETVSEPPVCKQRFRPSKLEILIGSLIVIGLLYLLFMVMAREPGDNRKLVSRIQNLEQKAAQQGEALDKGLQGLKPAFQQLEARLKAMEDQQKQMDAQLKQLQARSAAPPPRPAVEEKKPAPAPAGKEKIVHKVKSGETVYSVARKYRVSVKDLAQWNKIPPNSGLKIGDSLVIYKK